MDVALVVPESRLAEVTLPGTVLLSYGTALDLVVTLRATANPAVIWSDGLEADSLEAVAAAVRDREGACIEVRSKRWDGATFSPLSAACRGVISGFGEGALAQAADLLR
ncbi:MAG: hypothetical protein ABIP13_06255 [Tepidiformaceae bacterium]